MRDPEALGGAIGHVLARIAGCLWPLLLASPGLALGAAVGHFFIIRSWGFWSWVAALLFFYIARDLIDRWSRRKAASRA